MRKLRKEWEPVADMMARLSMPIPLTGCFEWLGKIGTGGYAYIAYREDGKRYHRKAATVALELAGRPGPEGLEVSHICPEGENRACVNPDHLVWETHSENLKRRKPFARYKGNGIPDLPLALAIAKVAAAAERERCAQVVEEYLIENSATYIPIKIIADAIRRGSR